MNQDGRGQGVLPDTVPGLPAPSVAPQNLRQLDRKKQLYKLNHQSNTPLNPSAEEAAQIGDSNGENMALDSPPATGAEANTARFLPFNAASLSKAAPAGFESITKKLSQYLLQTYVTCNPSYSYQPINNPRRVLTKPSKHAGNDGFDNEDGDYILYVNDIMGSTEGHQYQIIDALGSGTFGQVVKCRNIKTKDLVALKVIKNKPAYYNQSLIEVAILDMIKKQYDPNGKHHLVRIRDSFVFRHHLCIAFEILSVNLYELIKQNQFRGLSTNLIRVFITQILDALTILYKAKIIHCDLKPENILLKSLESPSIKVIDLGSACHENQTVYTYIQSRFYRSPEVLLGLSYTCSIDMWSLGCIAAELFLGLPLFPGSSEYNQMSRIVELLGNPPNHMCDKGKNGAQYFKKSQGQNGRNIFTLKTMDQYMTDQGTKEQPSKRYFQGNSLAEIINSYPIMRKNLPSRDIELEMQNRRSFIDFLSGMLRLNPLERWTPQQAAQHPFITQKPFLEPYVPLRNAGKMLSPSGDTRQSLQGHPQQTEKNSEAVKIQRQLEPSRSNPNLRQGFEKFSYQEPPQIKEPPIIDSRYSQINGLFPDFQVKPANASVPNYNPPQTQFHAESMPAPSVMTAQHNPYGVPPNAYASSYQQNQSLPFALRKSQSQYSVPDAFGRIQTQQHGNSSSGHHPDPALMYIDGHPRHGDQGERIRIPSRIPSVAASVDWELFEGGASVPNSYASSRQSSFTDMHTLLPEGRTSQSYASPNSARHLPFQGRKIGSYSNEFVHEQQNFTGRISESSIRNTTKDGLLQRGITSANVSITSSPHQSPITHKKVKSGSFSVNDSSLNSFSRRPSITNNFFPQGAASSALASGIQQYQLQQQQQQQQLHMDHYQEHQNGQIQDESAPFSSQPIGINNTNISKGSKSGNGVSGDNDSTTNK